MDSRLTALEKEVYREIVANGFDFLPDPSFRIVLHAWGRYGTGPQALYLAGHIRKGDKTLRFCMPNTDPGVKIEDARCYGGKDLVDMLFDRKVRVYAPWHTTILANDGYDSLHVYLSPADAKSYPQAPTSLQKKIEEEQETIDKRWRI